MKKKTQTRNFVLNIFKSIPLSMVTGFQRETNQPVETACFFVVQQQQHSSRKKKMNFYLDEEHV